MGPRGVASEQGGARIQVASALVIAAMGWALLFPSFVEANHTAPCLESALVARFAGETQSVSGEIKGVAGTTDDFALAVCSTAGTDERHGNAVYAAFGPDNPTSSEIVQIGRIKCKHPTWTVCNDTQRAFFAWGRTSNHNGCGFFDSSVAATPKSLGSWSSGNDAWTIAKAGSSWKFYRDGAEIDSIPTSNICWTTNNGDVFWHGESLDWGDAIGGEPGLKYRVSNAQWRNGAGTWFFASLSAPCTLAQYPGFCTVVNATSLDLWADHD